jgi:hypothetical protein
LADEWEVGKDLEGSGYYLIELLSWHLIGGTEENYEKKSVSRVGVAAEI